MRNFLVILFLAVLSLSSCKNNESPIIPLSGVYTGTAEIQPGELSELTFMKFETDGTLSVETYRQIAAIGANCLQHIKKGTYTIVGKEFTFTVTETLTTDPLEHDLDGECPTVDQLKNVQGSEPIKLTGRIVVDRSRSSFNLKYTCEVFQSSPCKDALTYYQTME